LRRRPRSPKKERGAEVQGEDGEGLSSGAAAEELERPQAERAGGPPWGSA